MTFLLKVLAIFGVFCVQAYAEVPADVANTQVVRVRLEKSLSQMLLSGVGISVQGTNSIQSVAIPNMGGDVLIEFYGDKQKGIFWKLTFKNRQQDVVKYYQNKHLLISGVSLHKGVTQLPSKLLLARSSNKERTFDLVGIMPIKAYLAGVVSSEMPLSWPKEALKAQIIAARSYALSVMNENKNSLFQLEASTADQVFSHAANQINEGEKATKVMEAIEETDGVVLVNRKGRVLKAFYHSDCGGRTSSSKSVWGSSELEVQVKDQSCEARPKSNWSTTITAEKMNRIISSFFKAPEELFKISQIEFVRPQQGERITDVVIHASGRKLKMLAHQFRQAVGFTEMKSTNFDVNTEPGRWVFSGRGYGHGVGLCQWGTKALAQKGERYNNILRHYYPNSALSQIQ